MKKLILIMFLVSNIIFSQNNSIQFIDKQDAPDEMVLLSTSINGDNIFINSGNIVGDNDFVEYNSIWKYSISGNNWSDLITSPALLPTRWGNGEIIDDIMYRFNGQLFRWGDGLLNETNIIDLNTGAVTQGAENPIPRHQAGTAVNGRNIYVFGGGLGYSGSPDLGYTNSVYYYNVDFDSWTELPSMPEAKSTKGEFVDGKLYVIGGYNGNVSNKIDVYNPETNQWEYQYVMPFSVSANATAVYGDKIFIISDYTEMTRIIVFDTVNLSYTSVENNMINRRHFDAEIFNDELYVICGNYTSSLYESGLRSLQAASVGELLSLKNTFNHNLTIYPNPTSSIINIEQDFTTAKVYDISGRELLKSTSKTIDLSELPSSIYLLRLYDSSNKVLGTSKVVKQ